MKKKTLALIIILSSFLQIAFAGVKPIKGAGILEIYSTAPCKIEYNSIDENYIGMACMDSFSEFSEKLPSSEYRITAYFSDGHFETTTVRIDKKKTTSIDFSYVPKTFAKWCCRVADIYYSGYEEGVSRKTDLAFKYYKVAAEAGIESAIEKVGYFYESGLYPAKKYYEEATRWYEKLTDKTAFDELKKKMMLEKAAEFFSGESKSSLFEE